MVVAFSPARSSISDSYWREPVQKTQGRSKRMQEKERGQVQMPLELQTHG